MQEKHPSPDISLFFENRVRRLLKLIPDNIKKVLGDKIYIAGGAMISSEPNDIDIYISSAIDYPSLKQELLLANATIISDTNNALTIKLNHHTIQFCYSWKEELKELIESFDFAHIKLGACCYLKQTAIELYFSKDYETATLIGSSFYTGSEYPLSSFIRILKYIKRGFFSGKSYIPELIKILSDIIQRGYTDHEDLKAHIVT